LTRPTTSAGKGAPSPGYNAQHDPDARQHVAAVLGDQHQRLDRRPPCEAVMLTLRQACDVVAGIAQGAQLAAAGQGDGIIEGAAPACFRYQ